MTTLYDISELEQKVSHLIGEMKDARGILKEYRAEHDAKAGRECRCSECQQAKAWLARNSRQ